MHDKDDQRGSAARRRRRRLWLLHNPEFGGTGKTVKCAHCGKRMRAKEMTVDRIVPDAPYSHWNIQPAHLSCNQHWGARKDRTLVKWKRGLRLDRLTKEFFKMFNRKGKE